MRATSTTLAVYATERGTITSIEYDFNVMFKELAERGRADAVIVSTEEGFSPLGASGSFFEKDLDISYENDIKPLAQWNLSQNSQISLVLLRSRSQDGMLTGVILAPGENCLSYRRYESVTKLFSGRPHRDYYYNVTYEAISHACRQWGARRLAISHLSSNGRFHSDMAICHIEALMHFCDEFPLLAPESFTFCGCCIDPSQLSDAKQLVESGVAEGHRPIETQMRERGRAHVLDIRLDLAT